MTAGFSGFVKNMRYENPSFLGTMRFIFASAYTLDTAYHVEIGDRYPWLRYRGRYYSVSDLIHEMDIQTAYLLLGVNDIHKKNVEENIRQLDTIVQNTLEKSPDKKIVLITIPPVLHSYAKLYRHPEQIHAEMHEAMLAYCAEQGLDCVELSDRVCGDDGYLRPEFCTDDAFHFNKAGQLEWLQAFRNYAREQYNLGAWIPAAEPTSIQAQP